MKKPTKPAWSWFAGPPIPEGVRNNTLTRIAGAMRGRGKGFDDILTELRGVNLARAVPPLPEVEVRGIARSVARYPAKRAKRASGRP